MSQQSENDKKIEKKKSPLKTLVIVFIVLAVLGVGGFWLVYEYKSMFMGNILDGKNSEAAVCMKAISSYAEEYSKTNGSIPADKEYIVRGKGNSFEACELFGESGVIDNIVDRDNLYWAARFKDGQPIETWAANRPISDSEIVHFNRDDQVKLYKSDIMHGSDNVIGHCCGIEKIEYFH
ncbi:MAG: hypothetical protein KBA55_01665 [Ruminococcus sp.]|nr:hypothetical protein [Ruminococcus sp.]